MADQHQYLANHYCFKNTQLRLVSYSIWCEIFLYDFWAEFMDYLEIKSLILRVNMMCILIGA